MKNGLKIKKMLGILMALLLTLAIFIPISSAEDECEGGDGYHSEDSACVPDNEKENDDDSCNGENDEVETEDDIAEDNGDEEDEDPPNPPDTHGHICPHNPRCIRVNGVYVCSPDYYMGRAFPSLCGEDAACVFALTYIWSQ